MLEFYLETAEKQRKPQFFDKKFSTISTFSNVENSDIGIFECKIKTEKIDFSACEKNCKKLAYFANQKKPSKNNGNFYERQKITKNTEENHDFWA